MFAFVGGEDDLVNGIGRALGFAQCRPNLFADFPVQRGALQSFAVAVGVHAAGYFQLQGRAGVKCLRQRIQFLFVRRGQVGAAGGEILVAEFLAAAAEQRTHQ